MILRPILDLDKIKTANHNPKKCTFKAKIPPGKRRFCDIFTKFRRFLRYVLHENQFNRYSSKVITHGYRLVKLIVGYSYLPVNIQARNIWMIADKSDYMIMNLTGHYPHNINMDISK